MVQELGQKSLETKREPDIEECESSIAESGDDGGRSLSRRRGSDVLSRLSSNREGSDVLSRLSSNREQVFGSVPDAAASVPPDLRSISVRIYPSGSTSPPQPPSMLSHNQNIQILQNIKEIASILCSLYLFGIIGVLIRLGLKALFGPDVANVTSDNTALYIDLPANMVGCFFMGWVGVIFKKDISEFSELLAIGLSTGLMGSITTFSGWMQKVVYLTTKGAWVTALFNIILGMELAQMSLLIGIEIATFLNKLIHCKLSINEPKLTTLLMFLSHNLSIILTTTLTVLWGGSIVLAIFDFQSAHRHRIWLSCVIGPIGVWLRWYLSRLNGTGICINGKKYLLWVPWGTLLVNLTASCLMGVLSVINLKVDNKNTINVIQAFQYGSLGCMSTVSTFVVEIRAMYKSKYPWRAYAYILMSILPAFVLEILVYSVPVWATSLSQA